MKKFFEKFGLLVIACLITILVCVAISKIFSGSLVFLTAGFIIIVAVVIITIVKFRRYFVSICITLVMIMLMLIIVLQVKTLFNQSNSIAQSTIVETVKVPVTKEVVRTVEVPVIKEVEKIVEVPVIKEVEKIVEKIVYVPTPVIAAVVTPVIVPEVVTPVIAAEVVTPVVVPEVSKITSKIQIAQKIDGANETFASVVLSEAGNVTIESNVKFEVKKISDKVYHIVLTFEEGSHGTAVVSVSGNNVETNESTIKY